MKKRIILYILIVIMLSFLVSCKTRGGAIGMPPDINDPGFGVERTISGSTVTLTIYHQALDVNEIVLIAEDLPDGVNYVSGSGSIDPFISDGEIVAWLLARYVPQQVGSTIISDSIPTTITYQIDTATNNGFYGKWGLRELNLEGSIVCADHICADGCIDLSGLMDAVTDYLAGLIQLSDLMDAVSLYISC